MPIRLSNEQKARLAEATKAYARDEWDLEIGDLKAGLFVEFMVETFGPSVYNSAIREAQDHLRAVVGELDLVLREAEE